MTDCLQSISILLLTIGFIIHILIEHAKISIERNIMKKHILLFLIKLLCVTLIIIGGLTLIIDFLENHAITFILQ